MAPSAALALLALASTELPVVKHVVLVVADDLGWNDWSGRNPAIRTPTLDALANSGTVLANYYTHEVCSPTRGAMLTGRLAYRLGYQGVISSSEETGVPAELPMLPTLLKRAVEGTQFDVLNDVFKGPTLIAFSNEHPGAAARIFKEFAKGQDKFEIKAAAFEGKFLAANQIDVLASLPTREEGIAQLMSVIQGATSKLARTLAAIRDQKEATAA